MSGLAFDAHTHCCQPGEDCNLNAVVPEHWQRLVEAQKDLGKGAHLYLGVHPWYADHWNGEVRQRLIAYLEQHLCEGIGEIGLDFAKVPKSAERQGILVFPGRKRQMACFQEQFELARWYQVPVSLHLRGCFAEFCRMTEGISWSYRPGLVHGWGGDEKGARWLLGHGWDLSFRMSGPFSEKTVPPPHEILYEKLVKEYGNVRILRESDRDWLA